MYTFAMLGLWMILCVLYGAGRYLIWKATGGTGPVPIHDPELFWAAGVAFLVAAFWAAGVIDSHRVAAKASESYGERKDSLEERL